MIHAVGVQLLADKYLIIVDISGGRDNFCVPSAIPLASTTQPSASHHNRMGTRLHLGVPIRLAQVDAKKAQLATVIETRVDIGTLPHCRIALRLFIYICSRIFITPRLQPCRLRWSIDALMNLCW